MIQTYQTTFREKKELAKNVYYFYFDLQEQDKLTFIPGQYMILFCPQGAGKESVRRLFSLVNPSESASCIELVVEIIPHGIASEYFMSMQPGQEVLFQGPAGMFTLRPTSQKKILIATGTGIAPMVSILRSQKPETATDTMLLWGLRKREDVYLVEELKRLKESNQKFDFQVCLSQEEHADFFYGRVTAALQALTEEDAAFAEYYICGNRNMVEEVREYLLGKQVQKERIIVEKY